MKVQSGGKIKNLYSHHVSFQEMSGNVHHLVSGCFYLTFVGTQFTHKCQEETSPYYIL